MASWTIFFSLIRHVCYFWSQQSAQRCDKVNEQHIEWITILLLFFFHFSFFIQIMIDVFEFYFLSTYFFRQQTIECAHIFQLKFIADKWGVCWLTRAFHNFPYKYFAVVVGELVLIEVLRNSVNHLAILCTTSETISLYISNSEIFRFFFFLSLNTLAIRPNKFSYTNAFVTGPHSLSLRT